MPSNWSSIKTITTSGESPSQTTTLPTNSATTPDNNQPQPNMMIIIASVCIIAILLSIIAYQYKQRKTSLLPQTSFK